MSQAQQRYRQVHAALNAGKAGQAVVLARQALRATPDEPEINSLMGLALIKAKQNAQALHFMERAVELSGGDAGLLHNLGIALLTLNKPAEAAAAFERAIAARPDWDQPRLAHLSALLSLRQYTRIIAACDDAIPRFPGVMVFEGQRAAALSSMGFPEESFAALEAALPRAPDLIPMHNALCAASNYVPALSRERVRDIHVRFGQVLQRNEPHVPQPFPNTREPERPLRVGVLSPDLRTQSVAFFIEPFFEGHDRAALQLFAYHTNTVEDAVTQRLRKHAAWRACGGMGDAALWSAIRADRIDILIDLSGHMQGHRLEVLHQRAAPVQATYIGYPNTTGVPEVDRRIIDAITDPPGEADTLATEKLVRLPRCFLCYRPPPDAPAVVARPPGRPVAFGSFNALQKINPALVRLWARVLDAVPGSVLVLKSWNLADREAWAALAERFTRAGVAPDRVRLLAPPEAIRDHLGAYGEVDVALDTFPYHGTTTTCEALWMGVPVVTLAGDRHASRVGASLLSAAGLTELIARSEDEYVRIAAGLAADAARLADMRLTLRDRVARSGLRDEAVYCRALEAAIRGMWREWCSISA